MNNNSEKLNHLYKERLKLLNDIKTLNTMLSNSKMRLAELTDDIAALETCDSVG